jgi:zinc protease
MLDRTQTPHIKDAIDFNLQLKPYTNFTLNNGVEVYAIDAGAQDVVQLELVFYAGNSVEKQHTVAAATNHLLKNGTLTKTAFEINEHFDFYGAYCTRACYNETASITLHTLSKHLSVLLPVIKEIITEANFTEEELATYKQNSKQKLTVNLQKCDFVANRLIDAALYGEEHPYGKYNTAANFDALTTDLLKEHYLQHYINGNCVLFIAGKLPADIQEQLNNTFGHLPLKNHLLANAYIAPVTTFVPAEIGKKNHVTNDENGVQGAIRIARPFPNRHHPDFQKIMVLNTLFGGFFGSRLMSNIREDKGYTYGIHSYIQNHLGDTAWMISTEAGKDVCMATIEEVYKEMKLLQTATIDEEELLLVRNYMIGIILGDLDGPFQIIGRWKNIILNRLTADYFYNSIETIKTISAEELKELAKKYLNPTDFYELVVV